MSAGIAYHRYQCLLVLYIIDTTDAYLLLYLFGRSFGVLQVLHEGGVAQKVAARRRQTTQQIVLQILQLNLEIILLLRQLILRSIVGISDLGPA